MLSNTTQRAESRLWDILQFLQEIKSTGEMSA